MSYLVRYKFISPYRKKIMALRKWYKVPFYLNLLLICCVLACSEDDMVVVPVQGQGVSQPVVKPKGTPLDIPYTATIGPDGGVLKYLDINGMGAEINIPRQAVTHPTVFGIQAITNTHDEFSNRPAFRLSPEEIIFQKPVKVSFTYPSKWEPGAQNRMVAFQRNDGVWCGVSTTLDKANKQISVSTSHFSDWVWLDHFSLRQSSKSARKGEQVEIRLMEQVLGALNPHNHIDSLPLAAMDEVGAALDIRVSNWKILRGRGSLEPKINTHALKANAIYTAPSEISVLEEVEVQVEVESESGYIRDPSAPEGKRKFGKLILIAHIQLLPDAMAVLKLNGVEQDLRNTDAKIVNGSIIIRSEDSGKNRSYTFSCYGSLPGTYSGGNNSGQSVFNMVTEQGGQRIFHNNFYRDCNNEFIFNGEALILEVNKNVRGTFHGILYNLAQTDCENPEGITVDFQVNIPI